MEDRLLVKKFLIGFVKQSIALSCIVVILASSLPASAGDRQDIRFYRVNKDMISERFWLTRKKARKSGCHNLLKKGRLYRVVQFDYARCYVYTKPDCQPDSIQSFKREKEDESVTELLEGYSWFAIDEHERGAKVKSWQCEEKTSD